MQSAPSANQYAKVIENSKRVRWDIDDDVIRNRRFDLAKTFLPAGLSLVNELDFMTPGDRRLLSQVQGRSYAYIFGLVERFIGAKMLEISRQHALGDQTALEALVRMTDEELKHQRLFRRMESMMADDMPVGYMATADPDAVASAVLSKSAWSVLALTLDIELFTQAHYRASIEPEDDLCALWKDVFLAHWKEESQHAMLDELEFLREDAHLSAAERDAAVGDLIDLVVAVDGILTAQASADASYFGSIAGMRYDDAQRAAIAEGILKAYRWQYIVSGVTAPRFQKILFGVLDDSQAARVTDALQPLLHAVPAPSSSVTRH
ncbi:hypothetical protein [Variovorax sp. YR216]|uniref:hypothetical protein n=1 Tax=Variovorax sp. YR216 TaxID=1882828 RepID=UPI00089CBDAC|nr:hypothetical protein [Variovorax sp. YR216]SEA71744.1 hypothetical protein SAMN05444680_103248 [Variovorax sp. YR216]